MKVLTLFIICLCILKTMSYYSIGPVDTKMTMKAVKDLLIDEGIQLDGNIEYTCAVYDDDFNVIGTGSIFGNTLRCFAVSSEHQGEGLMVQIISHLMQKQAERGIYNLFIYTKVDSAKFFKDVGFYEIAMVNGMLVFMENKKNGFDSYLKQLSEESKGNKGDKVASLVMNANPFTLGHLHLVETAASENDLVHLFIVSEDASLVPFKVRKDLIIKGTHHLKNIIIHESGPYIISNSTFPSYFLKEESRVIEGHAKLDVAIFIRIAKELGINRRYVGEEPFSKVTEIYNKIMKELLPKSGIECIEIKRKEVDGTVVSASYVRELIKNEDYTCLEKLVPESTLEYFKSPEAKEVIDKIKNADEVKHY